MNLRGTISFAFQKEDSSISLMVAKHIAREGNPRLQYQWFLWLKGGIAYMPNSLLQGSGGRLVIAKGKEGRVWGLWLPRSTMGGIWW